MANDDGRVGYTELLYLYMARDGLLSWKCAVIKVISVLLAAINVIKSL